MKTHILSLCSFMLAAAALLPVGVTRAQSPLPASHPAHKSEPIPLAQLGAVAGRQYQGDGLSVTATPDGARLRCVFQRLEGQATPKGLFLESTVPGALAKLHLRATAFGRERLSTLPAAGKVAVAGQLAWFLRPGLTEEYSVSVEGVRQDFVVEQRPGGEGPLRVELDVAGAKAEPGLETCRLVLDGSGRQLAYNRLRAVDAQGNELAARLEVLAPTRLAVVVDDAAATYPVRIDPTFSDADWISMGGLPGSDDVVTRPRWTVRAISTLSVTSRLWAIPCQSHCQMERERVVGFGVGGELQRLCAGGVGHESVCGGRVHHCGRDRGQYIAKWNGSAWSALGSGMDGYVYAWRCRARTCMRAAISPRRAGGGQSHCQMERERVVGLGTGSGENPLSMRWRCRATDLYAGGEFHHGGWDCGQITLPNGTGARGRAWERGIELQRLCAGGVGHDLIRGRRFHHGGRERRPIALPNGTGARGRPWELGWTTPSMRWRYSARPVCGRQVHHGGRRQRPITLPNGTGARGRPWARG